MRPMKRLIQLDEALRLSLDSAKPVTSTESVGILEASGRVCAQDVVSSIDVPPFSRSAMDGYAVRARDTFGASRSRPVKLVIRQVVYAGSVPRTSLGRGECAEIATGAMLPKGADAVIMVENTEQASGCILISEPTSPSTNVSRQGEDIKRGSIVIRRGEILNPSKVGALAAIGSEDVTVYSKPKVAVVPTGDEVAELGSKLRLGQVFNVNSYTLSSVIAANGGIPKIERVASDKMNDLEKALAHSSDCDMVVFSGGSSVGERDIMIDLLARHGKVVFHGIAVKPGKPTLFGLAKGKLIFGMPGYPTACLSNAYILLVPVLRKMARLPPKPPQTLRARMAKRVVSTTGRTQFLTVKVEGGLAVPAFKESGAITSMAHADGYVIIPSDVDLIEKEEEVTVHLF